VRWPFGRGLIREFLKIAQTRMNTRMAYELHNWRDLFSTLLSAAWTCGHGGNTRRIPLQKASKDQHTTARDT
jgi:hypothetical protein